MLTMTDMREIARHVITRSRLGTALNLYRRASGRKQAIAHLTLPGRGDRFSAIYDNRAWRIGKDEGSLSGWSSELEHTVAIRELLPKLLADLGTGTLLDVGCGDFNWMKEVALKADYVGMDIVASVIGRNQERHGGPGRRFVTGDAVSEPLPEADTVLCRAVLFHLSFEDVLALLANVKRSGARWLIATNDDDIQFNADIETGDYRQLNLRRRPFRLPTPVRSEAERLRRYPHRSLCVWPTSALPG